MFSQRSKKFKFIKYTFAILVIILSSGITLNLGFLNPSKYPNQESQKINTSAQKSHTTQLLKDPSFESPFEYWNFTIKGDHTDVNASSNQGEAHYNIMGEQRTYSLISDPPLSSNWTAVPNVEYPVFPDFYNIGPKGAWVSHYWREGPDQSVAVNWDQNITMPVDFSDFVITSANVAMIVNASVATFSADPPDYSDGVDTANDNCTEFASGDYVRFYVKISDLEKSKEYEIAHFQTTDLGQDYPQIAFLNDTQLIPVSEESLIIFLTSVLGSDNRNFTLTMGMRIWCEDNFPQDSDWWQLLRIKSINLNFTYEKKIDKFTTVEWEQNCGNIYDLSDYDIEITDAILNFKYKIDTEWPTSSSPNSEIRIFIGSIQLLETIKLSETNPSLLFQQAIIGGFNLKSLISSEENISISIQIYLADEFLLDQVITIAIDDVNLEISYIEFIPEPDISTLLMWILIAILLIIIGILGILSLRSYVFVPRRNKKASYLLLRTQKFKDINNIQGIILIHRKSGLPIYSHSYSNIMKGKKTLFSGFIQALSIIGEEISKEEPKKTKVSKQTEKLDYHKIVELDLKTFYCLILDIEELRTVLILKSVSSKRLKQIMFNFALALYLKISKRLETFDNDLTEYPEIIRPLLDEYFELFYKENFITDHHEKDIDAIKKKYKLSKIQVQIMMKVFTALNEKRTFRLMDIIEQLGEKDEDLIIDAMETLIDLKLIIPYAM
ncbi:MAG: hypothetical protein ACFFBI_06500 [Promethearchaeota archaeon]